MPSLTMDIERGRISSPSLILKSNHILKTRSVSYHISITRSGSNKTTASSTLSFIMKIEIFNPPTGSKTLQIKAFTLLNDFKIRTLRVQNPLILKYIRSIFIVIIDLFIWQIAISNETAKKLFWLISFVASSLHSFYIYI